jgi:hypothetical protein
LPVRFVDHREPVEPRHGEQAPTDRGACQSGFLHVAGPQLEMTALGREHCQAAGVAESVRTGGPGQELCHDQTGLIERRQQVEDAALTSPPGGMTRKSRLVVALALWGYRFRCPHDIPSGNRTFGRATFRFAAGPRPCLRYGFPRHLPQSRRSEDVTHGTT